MKRFRIIARKGLNDRRNSRDASWAVVAYLWVELIQSIRGILYLAPVNELLDLLSLPDGHIVLLRLQVGFLREVGRGIGIAFHGQVVEYQSVNLTILWSANCRFTR